MPDFTVRGNPAAIRSRATVTVDKGQQFFAVGEALATCTPEGWTGRAADHFREAHDLEPERWTKAGNGFVRAGNALAVFAGAVESAQSVAEWAEQEYARGEQVSADARAAYDADVARGREQQSNYLAQGIPFSLTILPFEDPGEEIRRTAVTRFEAARAELESAAQTCADAVRAGCADAPEEPGWLESGLRFVGGIFEGAGEAVWDLLTVSPFGVVAMVQDTWKLAHGDLTPEELMAKYRLSLETAEGMLQALRDDPVEFGKQLGKGLLDWDTWADDPARAIGHLVPDAVVAALTAGSGAAATRGAGALDDGLDALSGLNRMDEVADLNRLDDVGDAASDLGRVDLDDVPEWTHGRDIDPGAPGADLYPDGYDRYGGLGEQGFYDRYWNGDGWDYPTAADGHADGFLHGQSGPSSLQPGDVIDRYGDRDGRFASPAGTPFEQRALPPSSVGTGYTQFEVVKPLPESVIEGPIAPWFEQPGGGVQYVFEHPLGWYVEEGYLVRIP